MAVYFPSLKFLGVIRSSETVRQHRVLTTLIHGRAIHAALTTVSVITNLHRNLLPNSLNNRIVSNSNLSTRRYFLAINQPSLKLLGVIRSSKGAFKQGICTALLHGRSCHITAAAVSIVSNGHLDVLPDSYHSGVFGDSYLIAFTILSVTDLPSLELLVGRSSKTISGKIVFSALV